MIYCSCKYAPVELMAGFGEKMVRLDPSPAEFSCAEGCTHANMCSFAKAVIEEVHDRQIRQLILTDCCDAMRRTYDALKMEGNLDFLWILPLPHKDGERETGIFQRELEHLSDAYAAFSGRSFDRQLAVNACRNQPAPSMVSTEKPYLMVTGAHGGGRLLETVRKVFPDIPVQDATCSGNRALNLCEQSPDSDHEFFSWYARALLCQKHACMRMQMKDFSAAAGHPPAGIIFHTVKFCDYYGFEYMMLQHDSHPKMIRIETDTTGGSSGQLMTRLEAFREELGMNTKRKRNTDIPGKTLHTRTGSSQAPRYVAGIDSGSTSTDAVIMDYNRKILAGVVVPTAAGAEGSSRTALKRALHHAHLKEEDLAAVVTTGYGRGHIQISDHEVTEITCHAKGAHYLCPPARTIIDIGGQDSKVICIDENGKVQNFVMNDKCAAGTGRFLEMQAKTLGLDMNKMSRAGLKWNRDLTITSMCSVFAESEVVSLIADNTPTADIIHGLNKSIARRTASLVARAGGAAPFIMTGGVAQNQGVVQCLEKELKHKIFVSGKAQICGAIGACLAAWEQLESNR